MMTQVSVHKPLVTFDNVSKSFPGRNGSAGPLTALQPFNAQIGEGEFLAVVGPSGCGKSTLLSLIAGLQLPTTGQVKIAGNLVRQPYTDLGIVFQRDLLLPWRTALDNVLIQAEARGERRKDYLDRAHELLRMVGLGEFAHYYPHELSGGMRQRVGICRALLRNPPLILMDEPFAALDAISRDQLALDFQAMWQSDKRTVVFITHNISEAVFLSDRIVVMTARPGRIAEIIDVDIARPRGLEVQDTPDFRDCAARVRQIFLQHGILRGH